MAIVSRRDLCYIVKRGQPLNIETNIIKETQFKCVCDTFVKYTLPDDNKIMKYH